MYIYSQKDKKNSCYLKEEENMSLKVLLAIMSNWGSLIQNIENPTENMCIQAVIQDGYNLRYIKEEHQTPKVCLNAVKNNGVVLKYIINKNIIDREMALAACMSNGRAIFFIPKKLIDEDLMILCIAKFNNFPVTISTDTSGEGSILELYKEVFPSAFVNNEPVPVPFTLRNKHRQSPKPIFLSTLLTAPVPVPHPVSVTAPFPDFIRIEVPAVPISSSNPIVRVPVTRNGNSPRTLVLNPFLTAEFELPHGPPPQISIPPPLPPFPPKKIIIKPVPQAPRRKYY